MKSLDHTFLNDACASDSSPARLARTMACALALLWAVAAPLESQTATGLVTVDFADSRDVNSASGLLFAITPSTAAARLGPVRPRLFRFHDYYTPFHTYYSWTALAERMQSIAPDAELNLLLGPGNVLPHRQPPYDNWPAYEAYLTELVDSLIAAGLDGVWEVWNEPDFPDFWRGTREQFFELYLRAYTILRQRLGPDAEIAGPSFGTYTHESMEAFLEFCLANGCQVNALTFHANDDTPAGIAAFPLNAQDARSSFLDNPRYAPLKIRRLLNNEIGGPIYTRQPAGTLAHYAAFEAGGGDAAVRSCWNDSAGASDCFNGTLNGLLTAGTLQPRSVWWAHTLYDAGVATRVGSTVSNANIVALASRAAGSPHPQVLIGHVDFGRALNGLPGTLSAQLQVNNVTALAPFSGVERVNVRIESIPATGEAALAAPLLVQTQTVTLAGGGTLVSLPAIGVGGVLRVTLEPSTAPTISTIASQVTYSGTSANATFTVSDPDTPLSSLTLSGASSNPSVVPHANVAFAGSGATRTVTVTPAPNATGSATITVTVRDPDGRSDSTSFTLTVQTLPFVGAPQNLQAISITGNTVTLGWTPGVGLMPATNHVLEGGVSPGQVLESIPTDSALRTFTFAAPDGAFYVRLKAVSGASVSASSNEIRIYVNVPAAPSPPVNLLGMVNGSQLALSWTNTAEGGIPSAIRLTVTGAHQAAFDLPAAAEYFSYAGVPAGSYAFTVAALNATGASAPSNAVTLGFPGVCAGAPLPPTSFQATKSGSVITATWDPPASGPAMTGYTLTVTGSFAGSFQTTARTLSGSVGPGSYTLSVAASNPCGQSAGTTAATVTIP
jgi:xylan 1,4-beta-xylosidase